MPPLKKKVKTDKSRKKNIKRRQNKKDKKTQARFEDTLKKVENLRIPRKKLAKSEKRKLKLKSNYGGQQRVMNEFKNLRFD